ncbi:hypothetical protein BT69DRAFT_337890 [Atractiella rhizophila]|nr:hypothetical protein BT69DRAFT_337890 [Atractiella rhizophila]
MMDRQQDAVRLTNFESQSQPQGTPSIEFRRGSTYNEEVIDPNLRVNDPAHADDIPVNPLEFEDADGERHVYGNEYEHAGDLGVGAFPAFDADASLEGAFMGDSQPPSTPMMHPPAQIIGQKRPAPHSSGPFLEESTDDEASRTKPSKKKKYRTTNKRPNRGKPKARELPPVDDPPSDGEPNAPVRPEKYDSAFNKYRLDRNGPVQRRFWAPGGPEEQLLIQCLNRYGALARPWHEILKRWGKDGTKGDLFKDQNNVSLKDHARSIKNRYLREGLPMPPGLDKWVTAKKTLRALEEERRAAEERRRLEGREGEDGGEGSQMPESQLGDYQELSQTHSLA